MSPSLVPAAVDLTPRVESNSPIPVPGAAILAFDNTLGALFIGSSLATILYGILCLQIFIYITSYRTRQDSQWTRLSISFILCAESNSYSSAHIHHRNFLVAAGHDDSNDVQVLGVGLYESVCSGFRRRRQRFTFAQLIAGSCGILLTQLFFSWRVWMISRRSFRVPLRVIISTLTVILALFSFGYYIDLAVKGFNRVNTPDFTLAYTLAASSRVLFDIAITFAMTITLYRSRSGVKQMDHVITLVIIFIVNTNLLTTLLSISELVTFFAFPESTIYGGLGFLTPKLYCNALLASLNSRQFIRNELNPAGATELSASEPTLYTGRQGMGGFSAARVFVKGTIREPVRSGGGVEAAAQDSYEMTTQSVNKLPYLGDDM
ncbi:hypothetical protein PTI98_008430 [Pleurotus ostreatus]|nr:hypothetical protein PTI98_008430 [Pleurotus ostreatus]